MRHVTFILMTQMGAFFFIFSSPPFWSDALTFDYLSFKFNADSDPAMVVSTSYRPLFVCVQSVFILWTMTCLPTYVLIVMQLLSEDINCCCGMARHDELSIHFRC